MDANLNLEIRALSADEIESVSGGVVMSQGATWDIAGRGLFTLGTTTLPSGQKVAWAAWEPSQKMWG